MRIGQRIALPSSYIGVYALRPRAGAAPLPAYELSYTTSHYALVVWATPADRVDLSALKTKAGDLETGALARTMSGGMIVGSAVDHWERICPGVPTVGFCVDRAHSELVAERFRERRHRALHLDGETPSAQRRAAITPR
ncbi:MAG: ATP-dependent helicase [Hyphomicrobiales bacterium]|nr:ATP-dependent helicase [Hyphomicrobiales bacterium]